MITQLKDYVEIQRYLQESIDGVTWDQIGEQFANRFDAQDAVNAACKLMLTGFAEGLRYEKNSPLPATIRGCEDGIDRLREVYAMQQQNANHYLRKGWRIEDSIRIYEILTAA